ncbi:MAG: hypothetical protein DLM67_07690 [Candidatus Nephthysia bennettiae]|nr:hypothetical protein [Candidatus Dormibacteraeota bacterium]PZR97574.1 MAG: hypothetical protein DLM67_07690 [Candidatus Dormibacteraeota bacterium]
MNTEGGNHSAVGTNEPGTVASNAAAGPQSSAGDPKSRVLSQNGTWWWNGRRWVSAVSEDGLWRWNGSQWRLAVGLDGKRPEELAKTFTALADDCYARAGAILTERVQDWQPEGEVEQLAGQARGALARLREAEPGVPENGPARGRLLGRHAPPRERVDDDDAREALTSEYVTLAVRLARRAPQPTFKEADDVLTVAHMLDERAGQLNSGVAEVEGAERQRAEIAVSAQGELTSAEEARTRALDGARKAIESAELAHRRAVSGARAHLRSLLTPGPGELKAALGALRLHATSLETPAGRLPAAGLSGFADSAEALWQEHRRTLADLVLVGAPETDAFLTALTEKSPALFLLFDGPAAKALCAVPSNQGPEAQRFAATLTRQGAEAKRAAGERDATTRQAESDLEAALRNRSSVEAAEGELSRLEGNPALLGAIDASRRRLERARGDTPELIAARRRVVEVARQLVAPPEPLHAERVGAPAGGSTREVARTDA